MVIYMKRKRLILLGLIAFTSFSLLSATSLNNLVNEAVNNSDQITNLKLNKDYTMLSIEGSELDAKTKVNVSTQFTSPNTLNSDSYEITSGSSNLVTVIIPGDYIPTSSDQVSDTTTITLDGGLKFNTSANGTDGDPKFDAKTTLGLSHNFLIGDYTNNQKDLNNQITLLKANQTYENGVVDFKQNVYSYVKNILANEKSKADIEKKITDQEKIINDSLKLNQISKDSIAYKQYDLALKAYQDSLETLETQHQALLENFKEYTGIDYKDVDDIRMPNLEINSSSDDSLSVQLAKLNVRIKQDTIDQVEREKTQSYINFATQAEKPYAVMEYDNNGIPTGNRANKDMTLAAQATYGANNFTLNAGTNLDIDFGTSVSPVFQVGGTWTNDTTTESDIIDNKLNENALISAQLAQNATIQSVELTKLSLKSQVTNWNAQYKQLENNIQFNKDNLELKKQMLDLGLATKSEIDDIEFDLSQLNYDKLTLLIDGLTIELDIEQMNL